MTSPHGLRQVVYLFLRPSDRQDKTNISTWFVRLGRPVGPSSNATRRFARGVICEPVREQVAASARAAAC